MLTPEATETPIPPTGEVRPKIGPTAQTGARTALDDADWRDRPKRYERGVDNAAIYANLRLQTR